MRTRPHIGIAGIANSKGIDSLTILNYSYTSYTLELEPSHLQTSNPEPAPEPEPAELHEKSKNVKTANSVVSNCYVSRFGEEGKQQ